MLAAQPRDSSQLDGLIYGAADGLPIPPASLPPLLPTPRRRRKLKKQQEPARTKQADATREVKSQLKSSGVAPFGKASRISAIPVVSRTGLLVTAKGAALSSSSPPAVDNRRSSVESLPEDPPPGERHTEWARHPWNGQRDARFLSRRGGVMMSAAVHPGEDAHRFIQRRNAIAPGTKLMPNAAFGRRASSLLSTLEVSVDESDAPLSVDNLRATVREGLSTVALARMSQHEGGAAKFEAKYKVGYDELSPLRRRAFFHEMGERKSNEAVMAMAMVMS